MKLGLASRLALVFTLLVALTAFVTSGASVVSTNRQITGDIDQFLENRVDEMTTGERLDPRGRRGNDNDRGDGGQNDDDNGNNNGDDDDDDNDNDNDNDEADEATDSDVAAANVDLSPAVEADTEAQTLNVDGEVAATIGVALPVSEADRKLAAESGPSLLRTVTVDGVEYRMITSHLTDGGAVQVAVDLEDTKGLLGTLRVRSIVIGLVMSGLAGLVGWALARRTTRPLRQLAASAEKVAATRDLSATLDLDRDDEIGRLADSFDEMLRALAQSRDQQHRLVQDAAHELRTPLTSINANIDLLTHAPDLDPEIRAETLAGTRSELRQLNALFTEIIELATDERDAPARRSLDLAAAAASSVNQFRSRSAIPVELRAESSTVTGDRAAIERAIDNLLSNAAKYGDGKGPIAVTVSSGTLRVDNPGTEVSAVDLDRVFDRFFRSDAARSQPGAGLGLAIVDKIVTDHGGRAWLRNRDGGVEAGFELPLARSEL